MKNLRHPNVILAIVAIVLLIIAVALYANGFGAGYYFAIASLVLWTIHYVIAVIDVSKTTTLTSSQRTLWLILVIIVPAAGSLLYYFIHSHNKQLD